MSNLQIFVDLLAEIALHENENSQLCSLVQNQHDKLGEPFWQKSLIFCNMLAGNQDSAQFGVTMLQDIGEEDDLFFALIDRLSGFETDLPEVAELSSLHLCPLSSGRCCAGLMDCYRITRPRAY